MRKFTFYKHSCLLRCSRSLGGRDAIARSRALDSHSLLLKQVELDYGALSPMLTFCVAWTTGHIPDSHPSESSISNVTDHSMLLCYLLLI